MYIRSTLSITCLSSTSWSVMIKIITFSTSKNSLVPLMWDCVICLSSSLKLPFSCGRTQKFIALCISARVYVFSSVSMSVSIFTSMSVLVSVSVSISVSTSASVFLCLFLCLCLNTPSIWQDCWNASGIRLTLKNTWVLESTMQHTATHRNTLQHVTTHCNSLQLTATHCNTLQHTATHWETQEC